MAGRARRKRVLLTVNPQLIQGKRLQTVRSMATVLDAHCDLLLLPIDEYDLKRGTAMAYKRGAGGKFNPVERLRPEADLWIVYTDGYWMDSAALGYKRRIDYLYDQMCFHDKAIASGRVGQLINTTDAERTTLKNWFAGINCERFGVIPTFVVESDTEARDLLDEHETLVAKPVWGGAGTGVRRISNRRQLNRFLAKLGTGSGKESLADYCFQLYMPGDEKRLWFLGDQCIGGRVVIDRATPWSRFTDTAIGKPYSRGRAFECDAARALKLWKKTGLKIGSVDFLGDQINELNGCGTIFTYYNKNWELVADQRPMLTDYLVSLL